MICLLLVGNLAWGQSIGTWESISGFNGNVEALLVDAEGNLYAAGWFTTAGGVSANLIAKWDGSSWSSLGSGIWGDGVPFVKDLAFDGSGNLYVGGNFESAGGISAYNMAKWNGSTWMALGNGLTGGSVMAVAVDASNNVYAGGAFTNSGSSTIYNIAKWNGSSWSTPGGGLGDYVRKLEFDLAGNLYACGDFRISSYYNVGILTPGYSWKALGGTYGNGTGFNNYIWGLSIAPNGNIYASGFFTQIGGYSRPRIAVWNGTKWLSAGTGFSNGAAYCFAFPDATNMYAGGGFTTAGGITVNNIAKYDGSFYWTALGTGFDDTVWDLVIDNAGHLYAGGQFTTIDGKSSPYLARYVLDRSSVDFTNGNTFIPTLVKGENNQVIGRFRVSSNKTLGYFTKAVIKLNGTRSGLSQFKLWESIDDVFNFSSDFLLGNIVETDPGDGNSITFQGFKSTLETSDKYYFITCTIASDATGDVQCVLVNNNSLMFYGGELNTILSNETLSQTEVPLSISLVNFNAISQFGTVLLTWQTASETDNSHFLIYQNGEVIVTIDGAGTTSEPHSYEYIDDLVIPGNTYTYILADVDYANKETKYTDEAVTVTIPENDIPREFSLEDNYPNPFNPQTTINYQLPTDSDVELSIYNMSGRMIATLVNEHKLAGYHEIGWNASSFPSGIYFYRLQSGGFIETKKMVLMK
jgi:hypothetical protein